MNIVETIANDFNENVKIEAILANVTTNKKQQTFILDGLDFIKINGKEGISLEVWKKSMKRLYPKKQEYEINRLYNLIAIDFKDFIHINYDNNSEVIIWKSDMVIDEPDDDSDINPELEYLAKEQIRITYSLINAMKRFGTFSRSELISILTNDGIGATESAIFVDHVLNSNKNNISSNGDDTYTYSENSDDKTINDHLASFKQFKGYGKN